MMKKKTLREKKLPEKKLIRENYDIKNREVDLMDMITGRYRDYNGQVQRR